MPPCRSHHEFVSCPCNHTTGEAAPSQALYSGRWTTEEEVYVEALRQEFKDGTLDIAEGS